MSRPISICWFRQDLRLSDNPALSAAAARGDVLPVYILDDVTAGDDRMGAASRWWLHHSLTVLKESLGGTLYVAAGDALASFSSGEASTIPKTFFWLGQITNQTFIAIIIPNHIPIPIAVFLPPPLPIPKTIAS